MSLSGLEAGVSCLVVWLFEIVCGVWVFRLIQMVWSVLGFFCIFVCVASFIFGLLG